MAFLGDPLDAVAARAGPRETGRGGRVRQEGDVPGRLCGVDPEARHRGEVGGGEEVGHVYPPCRAPASASSSRSRSRYCPYSLFFIAVAVSRIWSAPM